MSSVSSMSSIIHVFCVLQAVLHVLHALRVLDVLHDLRVFRVLPYRPCRIITCVLPDRQPNTTGPATALPTHSVTDPSPGPPPASSTGQDWVRPDHPRATVRLRRRRPNPGRDRPLLPPQRWPLRRPYRLWVPRPVHLPPSSSLTASSASPMVVLTTTTCPSTRRPRSSAPTPPCASTAVVRRTGRATMLPPLEGHKAHVGPWAGDLPRQTGGVLPPP